MDSCRVAVKQSSAVGPNSKLTSSAAGPVHLLTAGLAPLSWPPDLASNSVGRPGSSPDTLHLAQHTPCWRWCDMLELHLELGALSKACGQEERLAAL